MKTVRFTINGDAAAAIDKTIKLRAASPRISNIVEVRISRPQALPTTYTVKFIIPDHIKISVAYKLGGVNKSRTNIGHDATEAERTITVDSGSEVGVLLAIEDGWILDDPSEKKYTITADRTITIPTPYEKVIVPDPYTVTFVTTQFVSAKVEYISGGIAKDDVINKDSDDKFVIVDAGTTINVTYWANAAHYELDAAYNSLSKTITEDTTITFPEATYDPPVAAVWWPESIVDTYAEPEMNTDNTWIRVDCRRQDEYYNSVGIECYQELTFEINYFPGGSPALEFVNAYNPTLVETVGSPNSVMNYLDICDDGSGPGGLGKLYVKRDPAELGSIAVFIGKVILHDPVYPYDDEKGVELSFHITIRNL